MTAPNFIEAYMRLNKLGEGTYGIVYKGREKTTGKFVALKKFKLESDNETGLPSTALREIAVLKELNHPNIVRLLHVHLQGDDFELVFEYLECDLRKYMETHKAALPPEVIKSYLYQLLNGIRFCHGRRIIHRDLKPQNLLLDGRGRLKIADFGLARCFGVPLRKYTHEVVTLWYRAPEIFLGSQSYSISLDLWSIGCIYAEMALHHPLFAGDSEIDQIFKIFQTLGTPNEETWPGVSQLPDWKPHFPQWEKSNLSKLIPNLELSGIDLLECFLTYSPGVRISAKRALNHPYFYDFDISALEDPFQA